MDEPQDPPDQGRPSWPRLAVALALIAVGVVWMGQGIGWIGGSFMTGEAFWAVMGVVCLVGGAAMLRREVGRR